LRKTYRLLAGPVVAVLGSLLLLYGCAEIGRPPGGEVDRVGPYLVESHPENGALSVAVGNEIVLLFSEKIVKPDKGKAVFVSPRPDTEPEIKFKGNRLTVRLREFFRSDQTYIVTISNALTDLRRNKLDSSISVAFSTGEVIDTGAVSGLVVEGHTPATGMVVGLFAEGDLTDSVAYDSVYPRYITTTDQKGRFVFRHLPDGNHRLIAFKDNNHNERFNLARETFALPDRSVTVGGDLPLDELVMSVTSYDTASIEILTVSDTRDGLVRVRLSRPVRLDLLGSHPSNLLLRSLEDTLRVYPAYALIESDTTESTTVQACFDELQSGEYKVELTYDADILPLVYEHFTFERKPDENPPAIIGFRPDNQGHFAWQVDMRMKFSEPMDTMKLAAETFVLWEDSVEILPMQPNWASPLQVEFTTAELTPGRSYRLDVAEFDLVDLAGNALGDSLQSYEFSTLDEDSLGSITGEITIQLADRRDAPVMLTFKQLESSRSFDLPVDGRAFSLPLPPGKYLLSGYIDENQDGGKFDGMIAPFRLAETFAFYPDTLSVRARFETAGVLFEFK